MSLYQTMNEAQLRSELITRDDELARMERSRDHWHEEAQQLEMLREERMDAAAQLAEAVLALVGYPTPDESIEQHNLRNLARDIVEAAS